MEAFKPRQVKPMTTKRPKGCGGQKPELHCLSDERVCRPSYCACQCEACFEAYWGVPRTPEQREQFEKLVSER